MSKRPLLLVVVIFHIGSCAQKGNGEKASKEINNCSTHVHHHAPDPVESAEPGEESIFNLSSTWKNQENDEVDLSHLGGKVSILSMVYTHCQFACPRILADMQAIEQDLRSKGVKNVNYVLVSIDPERDTPERLKAFYLENKLTTDWILLTSSAGNVMELAMVLGVKYKTIGNSDFSHSNLITVLNEKGEIMHRQEGLGSSSDETVSLISENLTK